MLIHNNVPPNAPYEHIDFTQKPNEAVIVPVALLSEDYEDVVTNRIARLASQHHISEYSRLKYGPSGFPGRYVPLSKQAPQTFKELKEKQLEWSNTKTWWISEKTMEKSSPIVLGPSGAPATTSDPASDGLAQQLSAAMDEQLPQPTADENPVRPLSDGVQSHTIKTSASHPINISAIIPPEIVHILSSHLMFSASAETSQSSLTLDPLPVVFEVPMPFTLDRFILSQSIHPQAHFPPSIQPSVSLPAETMPSNPSIRTRSHVTEALQAAINSGIKGSTISSTSETSPVATFHSNGSSISLSISLQTVSPSHLSTETTMSKPGTPGPSPIVAEPIDLPSEATPDTGPPTNAELQAEAQLPSVESAPFPAFTATPSFVLGNLFLSSCPGKKVRLQGPVKGRSGVCRDLYTDLQRMKDLGVGCIVCCLDDTELEFLGAPWHEYQATTNKIGLDVLRLPTPEGLAPSLSPALLDKELTVLIQNYTLRGIPVLVHCRGGVGRAGVISACWILKLGLCGWLGNNVNPSITKSLCHAIPSDTDVVSTEGALKQDALELLERVIAVVRRRRSVKAVETYEQAQFLLDFIEHLRLLHTA
ncbi:hypothetical protein GYMLUDRAFT_37035 [Collybiopsis luxurians FD-317 M1]|nr:hypothetical protein GYMLUDRAFT_37035 [Collybiopsis luxurians FD-317 M1]